MSNIRIYSINDEKRAVFEVKIVGVVDFLIFNVDNNNNIEREYERGTTDMKRIMGFTDHINPMDLFVYFAICVCINKLAFYFMHCYF